MATCSLLSLYYLFLDDDRRPLAALLELQVPLELILEHESLVAARTLILAEALRDVLRGLMLGEVGDIEIAGDAVIGVEAQLPRRVGQLFRREIQLVVFEVVLSEGAFRVEPGPLAALAYEAPCPRDHARVLVFRQADLGDLGGSPGHSPR